MKKIEEKINLINEQLLKEEYQTNKKFILSEMKRIGIEELPYSYSALKNFIDSETMSTHYNKHYKGYVKKLNKALSQKDYGDLELEEIVKSISKYDETIRNNAGGAFNHALFWKMLSPKKQKIQGDILEKIKKDFGSYREFKTVFEEFAQERFGSGWVWLILTKGDKLKVMSTPNQDNPLMNVIKNGGYPILGLDLWEHAYYLKYKNEKNNYIKNFWDSVNWMFVNKMLNMKMKTKLTESIFSKNLLIESKSTSCTYEMAQTYRFIFNINDKVKEIFMRSIGNVLKNVFPNNFYRYNEYEKGQMSGIYDLEKKGRSVINKLNTNYYGFCILVNDLNKLLKLQNQPVLDFVGKTPQEQIDEVERMTSLIERYGSRIFNQESDTFKNIMEILDVKDKQGNKTEDLTVKILKKKFGDDNVTRIGELGSKLDMVKGIDCIIKDKGREYTAQIKPYSNILESENEITILNSGQVKKYTTDWIIFSKGTTILVFENSGTKIVDGNFVFPQDSLIYTLS